MSSSRRSDVTPLLYGYHFVKRAKLCSFHAHASHYALYSSGPLAESDPLRVKVSGTLEADVRKMTPIAGFVRALLCI